MRRVRYSVAMSLDGFIAGPNGENDWIVIDPEIDLGAIMRQFDTILLGRKTFEVTRRQHGSAGMPGMDVYVFSRTLPPDVYPGVTVCSNAVETITSLKTQPGKDLWLFGGGELFNSLLELGLVDAVEVAVIPVLLGGGIPLLPSSGTLAKLKLVESKVYEQTGTVSLAYEVIPPAD